MKIQRAVPAQAAQLTDIALVAKRYWRYPERWIEVWRPQLTITPEYIAAHAVYTLCAADGEVLGFYALRAEAGTLQLDHLWLSPGSIGRGHGRRLFEHASERARELGASALEIEADPNARGFYERLGARLIGEHITAIEGQPRHLPLLQFDLA